MSTKWTVAALAGLIANARVAPALFVAHVYRSIIGQHKVVVASASLLTALVLAGLATCCIPVDSVKSTLVRKSRVICQMKSRACADTAAGQEPSGERSTGYMKRLHSETKKKTRKATSLSIARAYRWQIGLEVVACHGHAH